MKRLRSEVAQRMGFSTDMRKRKRQHRRKARHLLTNGGLFNGFSAPGSNMHAVAMWHLEQARAIAMQ